MRTISSMSIASYNADPLVFDNSNFVLVNVSGLESPTVRLPRFNLPGTSGAFISNALYGERAIKIKGVVNAPDGSRITYLSNRTKLINAIAFARDNSDVLHPNILNITLENGQQFAINCYVDTPVAMGFTEDQTDYEEFLITLVSPDATITSSVESSYSISLPIGGGTTIPTVIPISLAPSSGGVTVVNNIGSAKVYPIITLTADLTNPYINNQTTGEFMKINYVLSIGDDPLVIDCGAQTITQGASDVTGIQSIDSQFWGLLSGNNTIGFSAAAGSGTANVAFYPAFFGI